MNKKIIGVIGILAVVILATIIFYPSSHPTKDVTTFSSAQALQTYLKQQQSSNQYSPYAMREGVPAANAGGEKATVSSADSNTHANQYSQTNNQVQNVDEPDFVKNDDKYIYLASQGNITIIDAYPAPQAKIISVTNVNGTIQQLLLSSGKLIVFGQEQYYPEPYPALGTREGMSSVPPEGTSSGGSASGSSGSAGVATKTAAAPSVVAPSPGIASDNAKSSFMRPFYYSEKSFIKVYDISQPSNPVLEKTIRYDGSFYDARMINNKVYAIVNQPIQYDDKILQLPKIQDGSTINSITPQEIYYFDMPDYSYRLTTIMALDLDRGNVERKTFLTGYTQTLYVSENNIYLTATKQMPYTDQQLRIVQEAWLPYLDQSTAQKIQEVLDSKDLEINKQQKLQEIFEDYYNQLPEDQKQGFMKQVNTKTQEIQQEIQKELEKTVIHKISISGNEISYKAKGEVPGQVLNQFSMDEYKGKFRIATTSGQYQESQTNNLYVLNEDLTLASKIEGLAPQERIYSARFLGDRAYLVTFKSIDPLFVIDLKGEAKVLGELKIPGYSDYLHPYDENHIIGIGKDVNESQDADKVHTPGAIYYTAVKGIKMSLFDVSDVKNPKEISTVVIGDSGTESSVVYDHKAFLFDKAKGLLVLPVSVHQAKPSVPSIKAPEYYGNPLVFEGAYIYTVNDQGFVFKGKITHLTPEEEKNLTTQEYYYPYNAQIQRSLYLDNTLYTISPSRVKANFLDDLHEEANIALPIVDQPVIMY